MSPTKHALARRSRNCRKKTQKATMMMKMANLSSTRMKKLNQQKLGLPRFKERQKRKKKRKKR